jgi:regulator of sigma D
MTAEVHADPVHSKAVPDLVCKLLTQRQAMLVSFTHLANLKPYTKPAFVRPLLKRFCQRLMDYIALGHFEVYQCIEEVGGDVERCRNVRCLARTLYPDIIRTTKTALAFNDRYEGEEDSVAPEALGIELSELGEQLADRIELEDRLITAVQASSTLCPRDLQA